jgi:signal transduction histidine kinase
MAPNTALGFLILGASLLSLTSKTREIAEPDEGNRRFRGMFANSSVLMRCGQWFIRLGIVLVCLISALRLLEFVSGTNLGVDSWFLRVPTERFGLAPLGKMAFFTASGFLGASISLVLRAWDRRGEVFDACAGTGALVAGALGLVFALGYLFSPNSPLLYGSDAIPMALNTAVGFIVLGIGSAAAGGTMAFPLRRLCGPSIHARLLRIFLPLVVGTVVVVAWLTHVVSTSAGASSAALSSAALATAAIFLFGVTLERMAGRVGDQIERAEAALQKAHDELEIKVHERTAELSEANSELLRAFRELNEAHASLQRAHEELRDAQGRMLQQAKLAGLGQTAAGVAHEINNPLAFVTNNITVLQREVAGMHDILRLYQEAESTLAEYQRDLHKRICALSEEVDLPFVLANLGSLVERSREGLKRIQKIVADLRDFARLDEADYKEADLNVGISTTVNLVRGLAEKQHVRLETDLAPIPRLTCFPAKINLVVQNLIFNAIDACPSGGRIAVRTRVCDNHVEVEVEDNGVGIDQAARQKIFDPFFTTKPIGMGTGLGLSMSYGIIKEHGGMIDFESNVGQGTRFFFRLPLAARLTASQGRATHVDDEQSVTAPA